MEIIVNGIKYELRTEEHGAYVVANDYKGEITIPAQIIVDGLPIKVIGIARAAFRHCKDVTAISLPEGLTTIETDAFKDLKYITEICIPESVVTIGEEAFSQCENLKKVLLPSKLNHLSAGLFSCCTSLENIIVPQPVKIIDYRCFSYCSNLKNIVLPEGLQKIESYAFENCESIEKIHIPSTVKDIGEAAFYYCTRLKSIVLPEGLEYVALECFAACRSLSDVVLPASVKMVEERAFSATPYKESGVQYSHDLLVSVGKLEGENGCLRIKEGTRVVCDSAICYEDQTIKKIICPSSLQQIGRKAFNNSDNLTEVVLNEGLEYIDAAAFDNCKNLTEIYIPSTVSRIEVGVFAACPKLKKIVVSPDNPHFDSRNNCNAIIQTASNTLICACPTTQLTDDIVEIGDLAFVSMESLEQIALPDSVKRIGWNAFAGCKNLQHITFPKNLEYIGNTAFCQCEQLEDLDFPASINHVGYDAFWKTPWQQKQPKGMVIIGNVLYKYIPYDEEVEEGENLPDCVIPDYIQSISEEAFRWVEQPIRIFLPKNLKSFNPISFSRCCYLDNFTIVRPDGVGEDYPFNDNTYHSAWIDGFFFMLDEKEKTASLVISADAKRKDWPNVLPDKVIYDEQAYLVDDDSRIVFRINKGTKKEVADIDRIIDQFIEQQLAEKANR